MRMTRAATLIGLVLVFVVGLANLEARLDRELAGRGGAQPARDPARRGERLRRRLLDDVRELVRDQPAAALGAGRELASAEDDVAPDRVGARADVARGGVGVGVQADA